MKYLSISLEDTRESWKMVEIKNMQIEILTELKESGNIARIALKNNEVYHGKVIDWDAKDIIVQNDRDPRVKFCLARKYIVSFVRSINGKGAS
jgi:hypothetical protein